MKTIRIYLNVCTHKSSNPDKSPQASFYNFFFSINWNDLLGFVKGLRLYNIKSYK